MTKVRYFDLSAYDHVGRHRAREYWHDFLCEDIISRGQSAGVKVWRDLKRLKLALRKYPDDIWFVTDHEAGRLLGVLFAACETSPLRRMVVYAAADRTSLRGKIESDAPKEWCAASNDLLERLAKSNGCASIVYEGPSTWAEHFPTRMLGDDGKSARVH